MPRVVIIGGGITGLTAAYTLERETDFEITLVNSESCLGGKIQTTREDGFTIEAGPDSIFTAKPEAMELIRELGLEDELIAPKTSGYQLLYGGKLWPVPHGLANFAAITPALVEQAQFLSDEGKRRALAESSVPPGDGSDESIASFFTRRFGEEFSGLVAEPILAGTHAGDPCRLSMQALYPGYLAKERRDGKLSGSSPQHSESGGPAFVSFRMGMETLVSRLTEALTRTCFVPYKCFEVIPSSAGVRVEIDGPPLASDANQVLLAIPANAANRLVREHSKARLQSIRFASSAIVTCVYSRQLLQDRPMGTGFLTPFDSNVDLTGATWTSEKWPQRADEGHFVARFFFGGDGRPGVGSESELKEKARQAAERTLGIDAAPSSVYVNVWRDALPQYELGHVELVDEIERTLEGTGISVAGSSYRGVGIPDCIRQGHEAARRIAKELS